MYLFTFSSSDGIGGGGCGDISLAEYHRPSCQPELYAVDSVTLLIHTHTG